MKTLSQDLKDKAIALGLCNQWQQEWGQPDKDQLMEKYREGIDFCVRFDYPDKDYIKQHFDGIMQQHYVYVDDTVKLDGLKNETVVLLGNTTAEISVPDFGNLEIYMKHTSRLSLKAGLNAIVHVSMYDQSECNILNADHSNVTLFQYSDAVSAKNTENSKIKNRVEYFKEVSNHA